MRRLILMCALALAAAPGAAVAAGATNVTPPPAALTDFVCQRSPIPLNRAISVTAVIRHMTGASKLSLRFRLLRKSRGSKSFVSVSSGDLGRWKTNPTLGAQPGDVWRVRKPVVDLPAPAVYRFKVSFRWTAADGTVLGLTTLSTRLCPQP
jgi:hypothetical protein